MKTNNKLTSVLNDRAVKNTTQCAENRWESHHLSNSSFYQHRVVNLFGDFTPDTINVIIEQLLVWEEEDAQKLIENDKLAEPLPEEYLLEPIIININSYGGNTDELFALLDVLDAMDAPIITRGFGKVCSCGFVLFCAGDTRLIGPNCSLMYHTISGGLCGKVSDVTNYTEYMKDVQNRMNNFILEKTKIKKKTLDTWVRTKTDRWISAEQAIELGIATEYMC